MSEKYADDFGEQMEEALKSGAGPKAARFALACLGGIPYVGGVFGAGAGAWSEANQERMKKVFMQWLKLQEEEIKEIGETLFDVMIRLDQTDEKIQERIESKEYLGLIKKCFRDWSGAESEEKRKLIRNLLANAASTDLASNDVVRLFIEWIAKYSEAHFKVIACIYKNEGITRYEIWQNIHGANAREDSAEADLFKLIIYDLSTGYVIRQHREVDYNGNYVRQRARKPRGPNLTSAFDDEKEYELTALGKQFVHYTMNEIVPRIEENTSNSHGTASGE